MYTIPTNSGFRGGGDPPPSSQKRSVSNFAICSYLVVANTLNFLGSSSKLTSLKSIIVVHISFLNFSW